MEILLPVLLEYHILRPEHNVLNPLEALASSNGQDINDYFIQHFPTLMAHIFPYIAAEKYSLDGMIENVKVSFILLCLLMILIAVIVLKGY